MDHTKVWITKLRMVFYLFLKFYGPKPDGARNAIEILGPWPSAKPGESLTLK